MKGKEKTKSLFSFIFTLLKIQKKSPGLMIALFLSMTTMVAYELFYPYAMTLLVDIALPKNDTTQIIILLSLFGFGYFASVFANIIDVRVTSLLSVKVSSAFRMKILRSLFRLEPRSEAYENKILTYLIDDVRHIESSVSPVWRVFKFGMTLLYGSFLLLSFDFRLFLLSVALLPFTLVLPKYHSNKLPKEMNIFRNAQASLLASAKETRALKQVIRVLRLQISRLFLFKKITQGSADASRQIITRQLFVSRSGSLSIDLVRFIVLSVGVYFVISGSLTIGSLVGFLALVAILNNALSGIIGYQAELVRGQDALNTVDTYLRQVPERLTKTIHHLAPLSKGIMFENAGLTIGTTKILEGINIEIPKGHFIAFVGPSGAGKSTALKLLLVEHKPSEGRVLFDNYPIDEIEENQYFARVGVVFQEPRLFEGTIRENIVAANASATEQDIVNASNKAEIYDDIVSFEDGFDTFLQGGDSHLSGGQRQRVAIARALFNDPEILLLDEASSALDPFTDAAIEETLAKLHGTHTIVSVTHHLKTIKEFDKIYVFNKGHIEESGSHQELLEKKGLYADLWSKQNGITLNQETKDISVSPDWLRFVPVFSKLDETSLKKITDELVMERFDAGKTIFSEGDSGNKMYIIASGIVEISIPEQNNRGLRTILAKFTTGDFFGEIALLMKEPRTARAVSKSVCLFMTLTSQQLDKILAEVPKSVKDEIMSIAKERLSHNPLVAKH